MMEKSQYLAWKRELVVTALRQRRSTLREWLIALGQRLALREGLRMLAQVSHAVVW